jgi:hypothetical protein
VQSSSYLTFDAPDRGAPYDTSADGTGLLQMKVFCSDGATPPCGSVAGDQEDVKLIASVTDVRCVGTSGGCSAPAATYNGKLLFSIPLRVTDRYNGALLSWPGTAADTPLRIGVACSAGSCSLSSSGDAVFPGLAVEQKRAVWELGQTQVFDGGPDGDLVPELDYRGVPIGPCPPRCLPNGGETVFLEQGLFTP